ncbi:NnrU family protein [Rhodalgimonas zhirmunskyi]|uniref:NnrU family protein n=1 Tax=Rhodalgimonas zhirmunskyi TaxID=2964767 RepID=A0AAJ1X7M8_9RHOB|nr:NnrU family protein [Rhodoalgimonas zhirmunskyi]MDQ2094702.1 NnrU family protein [Rhodoalgimonas zhirmunskyi]
MTLLILGVLLWSLPHLFKRLAPTARANMGDKAKGPIALILLASIVLMVLGYRAWDGTFYWGRSPAMTGINNLLMLVSVYFFAVSGMKTKLAQYIRHPMLWGVVLWSVAHLLVNGDTPSFVLFGGLLIWSFLEMTLINAQTAWEKPGPAPVGKEIGALAGGVLVYGAITLIHSWLGYNPFG